MYAYTSAARPNNHKTHATAFVRPCFNAIPPRITNTNKQLILVIIKLLLKEIPFKWAVYKPNKTKTSTKRTVGGPVEEVEPSCQLLSDDLERAVVPEVVFAASYSSAFWKGQKMVKVSVTGKVNVKVGVKALGQVNGQGSGRCYGHGQGQSEGQN